MSISTAYEIHLHTGRYMCIALFFSGWVIGFIKYEAGINIRNISGKKSPTFIICSEKRDSSREYS